MGPCPGQGVFGRVVSQSTAAIAPAATEWSPREGQRGDGQRKTKGFWPAFCWTEKGERVWSPPLGLINEEQVAGNIPPRNASLGSLLLYGEEAGTSPNGVERLDSAHSALGSRRMGATTKVFSIHRIVAGGFSLFAVLTPTLMAEIFGTKQVRPCPRERGDRDEVLACLFPTLLLPHA